MPGSESTLSRSKSRSFCKQTVAILTVLCAVGSVLYITGAGEKIRVAINRMVNTKDEAHFKKRSDAPLPEPSEPLEFPTAAVAADFEECSQKGADVLQKKKGNAVDAAIATALCVGVVNAHSAGIGGGGFMIYYDRKNERAHAIDFREVPPLANKAKTMEDFQHLMHKYKIRESQKRIPGEGEFIGVPGELRGFELAWKKYGTLPWKDLFEPAIEIANRGFKATAALVSGIHKNAPNVSNDPGLRELFQPNGKFIKTGDLVRRTKYGKTLQRIADSNGSDIFYKGEMAKRIVKDLQSVGADITEKDLKEYNAVEVEPLNATLEKMKGIQVLTPPPPAGGAALIYILNILSGYNFTPEDMKERPVLTYHRMIEAFNFVAAKMTYLIDREYSHEADPILSEMMDPLKGEEIRRKINESHHPDDYDYYAPIHYHLDVTDGTTHLSVLDKDGNAVALTTSINKYFGAKFRSPELGIIYNDQLWDAVNLWVNEFNLEPDSLAHCKRPMSLASPAIILDKHKNVKLVIGAAGGKYIATALGQVLMNYFWFNDSLKDAVSKPRIHSQLFPNMVLVEPTFSHEYIEGLKAFGHRFITNDTALFTGTPLQIMGVVQLVLRENNGKLLALADYRKGGVAAGYR